MNARALQDEGVSLERGNEALAKMGLHGYDAAQTEQHSATANVHIGTTTVPVVPVPTLHAPHGTATPPAAPKARKVRADAGKPRLYVDLDLCGARFDISGEMGRDALKAFLALPQIRGLNEIGTSPAEMVIDALFEIIDRLRAKEGK